VLRKQGKPQLGCEVQSWKTAASALTTQVGCCTGGAAHRQTDFPESNPAALSNYN
jgi:hypothetical protein